MRKLASGGSDNLVSTQMPLLNHALDNGATRIQSVARGRRARKAYARQQVAAVSVQSAVRRYLSTLAVRAERRRRKVGSAIGGLAKQHAQSLHDWLIANGVSSRGGGGGSGRGSGRGSSGAAAASADSDIEQALAVRAGVTTVEQLAQLSESEVAALAARVFRSSGASPCCGWPALADEPRFGAPPCVGTAGAVALARVDLLACLPAR